MFHDKAVTGRRSEFEEDDSKEEKEFRSASEGGSEWESESADGKGMEI